MKWTDTRDIAIALCEAHPDVDPLKVRLGALLDLTGVILDNCSQGVEKRVWERYLG